MYLGCVYVCDLCAFMWGVSMYVACGCVCEVCVYM